MQRHFLVDTVYKEYWLVVFIYKYDANISNRTAPTEMLVPRTLMECNNSMPS